MDLRNSYLVTREIQNNLRELYRNKYLKTGIIPTGEYDAKTEEAVREFQNANRLEPTGRVDYNTWVALSALAGASRLERAKSTPIYPFERKLNSNVLSPGDESDLVLVVQIMLKELAAYDFDSIVLNGKYDNATEDAIRRFQEIHDLPVTGAINKKTWNELALTYNKTVF